MSNQYPDLRLGDNSYRTKIYYDTDGIYTVEYVCSAVNPDVNLDDTEWRIIRVRTVTSSGNTEDVCYPIDTVTDDQHATRNKSTQEFIFSAEDLATVSAYSYKSS